ncbi:MAG: ribosome silencing factor [Pyrinomonadaceae bacterium]
MDYNQTAVIKFTNMEEAVKEKSLAREEATETITVKPKPTNFDELDEPVKLSIEAAASKKAVDIVALDLRAITSFTEFFLIASGTNQRQVQAIADEIAHKLRKQLKVKPLRIEGYQSAEWVLLDFGDFIFHVFDSKSREFYDLERLWRDASRVELPAEL